MDELSSSDLDQMTDDELRALQERWAQRLSELGSENLDDSEQAETRKKLETQIRKVIVLLLARELRPMDVPRSNYRAVRAMMDGNPALSAILDVLTAVGAAGSYDIIKSYVVPRQAARKSNKQPAYTEPQLSERSQRALSQLLSVPYDDLMLRSIHMPSNGRTVATFVATSGDTYTLTFRIVKGIVRIVSLTHELP